MKLIDYHCIRLEWLAGICPNSLKLIFLTLGVLVGSGVSFAQEAPSAKSNHYFNGTITATNNGVSIIPSFTLGRPAAFFDLSIGGSRFSFDPMLRFGLDGKPWSFVLWGRYKVIKDKRFTLTVGGHPAFLFQEIDMMINNLPDKMMVSNRFLAGEINSGYKVSDRVSVGLYYLRGTALKSLGAQNSNFIAWNTVISRIRLFEDFSVKINPQVFFLKVDENSGVYVNSGFTFSKGKSPFQFQAFFNQKVKSDIAGDDLVWNLSLMFNFSNTYVRK